MLFRTFNTKNVGPCDAACGILIMHNNDFFEVKKVLDRVAVSRDRLNSI